MEQNSGSISWDEPTCLKFKAVYLLYEIYMILRSLMIITYILAELF